MKQIQGEVTLKDLGFPQNRGIKNATQKIFMSSKL